jgi:hypothetical protein
MVLLYALLRFMHTWRRPALTGAGRAKHALTDCDLDVVPLETQRTGETPRITHHAVLSITAQFHKTPNQVGVM